MSFPPNLGITSPFITYSKPPTPLFQELPSLLLPILQQLHSQFSTNKMNNGYSRIRKISSTRSQSVDLTDLSFPIHTPTTAPNYSNFSFKSQETTSPNHITTEKNKKAQDSLPKNDNEDGVGEAFGVILSRKMAIPSSKVNSELQQQKSSFDQNVGKKSVSVKRSVSVSEGYCRIHHQLELTTEEDDQSTADECNDQKSYTKKRGKLLKACRRLFGL